ncbi:MAG TPA: DsbE family thiol:disulfide interchange protein [Hyphomicrobiaceae bacterium]|nr:DsbE family thiol:disulfide interchange protein [Hyphomicrobiaceae bacterium]
MTGQVTPPPSQKTRNRRFGWVVAPLIVFLAMAVMFAFSLSGRDPSKLPSALLGKALPQVDFPALDGLTAEGKPVAGVNAADLADGRVSVVNFFASWCVPCVQEHPFLVALAQRGGVRVVGINYKDPPPGGSRFLGRYGNPYERVGTDAAGRGAIEWGVYGMPETFVVDGKGRIVFKHVGPIDGRVLQDKILPAIKRAGGG